MAVQAGLKSTTITNLDASPRVRNTAGAGGAARLHTITDYLPAMTTGGTAGGIMRGVRVPVNCYIKAVHWHVAATVTTVDCDVGLYYSDTSDGTSASHVASTATAVDADFFASAVDMKTKAAGWTDITFEAGTYLPSLTNTVLWSAVGLSSNPGGFFDICYTNTSTTSGAPILGIRVDYEMPSG